MRSWCDRTQRTLGTRLFSFVALISVNTELYPYTLPFTVTAIQNFWFERMVLFKVFLKSSDCSTMSSASLDGVAMRSLSILNVSFDKQSSRECFSSNRVNISCSKASKSYLCTLRARLKCLPDMTLSNDPLAQMPDSITISENPLPFIIFPTVPNKEQTVWKTPILTNVLLNWSEYCQTKA